MNDTERLDYLEAMEGFALLSDDQGHWAVSGDGFQNIPDPAPGDVETTFFIEKSMWKSSVREAIDCFYEAMTAED